MGHMTKLCECGCGTPTSPALENRPTRGYVKGQPLRFRKSHRAGAPPRQHGFVVEDRGYTTPCHVWTGSLSVGYGREKGSRLAYRSAWERVNGPVPDGLHLDHLCRVRACVNPDHLEPVTHAENMRRSSISRAAEKADLDASGVRALRARAGLTQDELAQRLGVTFQLVSQWEHGKTRVMPKHARAMAAISPDFRPPEEPDVIVCAELPTVGVRFRVPRGTPVHSMKTGDWERAKQSRTFTAHHVAEYGDGCTVVTWPGNGGYWRRVVIRDGVFVDHWPGADVPAHRLPSHGEEAA